MSSVTARRSRPVSRVWHLSRKDRGDPGLQPTSSISPRPPCHMLQAFYVRYPHVVLTYARMRPLFYPLTMVDGMAEVMCRCPEVGLLLCGG